MSAAAESQKQRQVAIVDDAYDPPSRESMTTDALSTFCEAVGENDWADRVQQIVGTDFLDPALIDDAAVSTLYDQRVSLGELRAELDALFADFDSRRNDLGRIAEGIAKLEKWKVTTFSSLSEFKESENVFEVVFLDYRLKSADESPQVARNVYEDHQAFVVLMSDRPAAASAEKSIRKQQRLLQGFFKYVPKEQLVDPDAVHRTMLFVPDNPIVCHAIHNLVDSLELILGGEIEEVEIDDIEDPPLAGQAVGRFMNVVRTLPIQDYALLCELTLADEGHPLGDYVRRLFGSYLVQQVFTTNTVMKTLKELDKLRFTEFLPLAQAPSESLKELYAASLVEPITNPWGEHPWESETLEGDVDVGN